MKKILLLLSLILLSFCGFTQSRYVSETTKKVVYTRDGGKCQCCESVVDLEYDHIVPFSCGGSNDASNIQLLCMKCNRSKSNSCICKIHNKTVGKDCCQGNPTVKESSKPASTTQKTSTASQCTGTTKKGARCKNRTTNANRRCYLH
ncbi:HNH endonuclease [Penaeicola halotolerans]|uniref:HNH endonuclease n=1 Tax=Penaeicola halotolerans TaxID=2793196 RepID=UPI001CF84CB0|nr:HNH endonuclease [Penaeicola halotolerans]